MRNRLIREETRRWVEPLVAVIALVCLAVVAVLIGSDSPLLTILLVPIAGVLVNTLTKSLIRRPRLSFDAICTGSTTTSRPDGARVVNYARIVLFLRNEEGAGEAKHCKVELATVASPGFILDPQTVDATRNLHMDTWRIVWQPSGTLGPGAERELPLRSQEFAFDDGSASAEVRASADRMDPRMATLAVRVGRYDPESGAAEFDVTVWPPPQRKFR